MRPGRPLPDEVLRERAERCAWSLRAPVFLAKMTDNIRIGAPYTTNILRERLMLRTDARICLCPLVHMQTTQEDECAGMDSVSPMQYLRRNIRMSAGSDKASDLNSVSADSLLKYCLSLPTCKSDIWSQKDYVVVKDRARGVTDGVLRGDFGDGKKNYRTHLWWNNTITCIQSSFKSKKIAPLGGKTLLRVHVFHKQPGSS